MRKTVQANVPIEFLWANAKDSEPKVKKLAGNKIYSISSMLLLHSKKHGSVPGYFVKYQNDHLAAKPPRKKGEMTYHSSDGTILDDVLYFFEIADIPAPVQPKKEAAPKKQPEPKKPVTT